MIPLRFILSVPRSAAPLRDLVFASRPDLMRPDRATAWIADGSHRIALPHGVLFGHLFHRGSNARVEDLAAEPALRGDPVAAAHWLTRETWGGWFALLADEQEIACGIARDPSPLLPVYRLDLPERRLFASHPELFGAAGVAAPKVSWVDLLAHLHRPELRGVRTCLEAVDEVAPGWFDPLSRAGGNKVRLWDPWTFAKAAAPFDRMRAVARLRATAIACIGAWARDTSRIAVAASGGVDSSLICAALAATDAQFACATVSTADPSGDESALVRKLAQALGAPVAARTYDLADVDLTRTASRGLPRPVRKAFMPAFRQALAHASVELGADAIFDGNGGDNLFAYIHSSAPALDRLWRHGPGRGFAGTMLDLCRLTESDLPTMTRALVRRALKPAAAKWIADDRLLARASAPLGEPGALTDWRTGGPPRMPGKRAHLELVMRAQNFLNDLTGQAIPMALSPLLSQPLIELCLSVPTWEWCRRGLNRSLAREAFAAELPSSVTGRVSKAGPDSFVRAIFAHNRPLLRELLLGGLLREQGLLDARALDAALKADEHGEDPILYRLLDLAEAETWARSWS